VFLEHYDNIMTLACSNCTKLQHFSMFCIVVLLLAQLCSPVHCAVWNVYSTPGFVSAAARAHRSPRRFRYTGGPTPGSWYYSKYVDCSCTVISTKPLAVCT